MKICNIIYRFKKHNCAAESIFVSAFNKLFRKETVKIVALLNKKNFAEAAELCSKVLAQRPNDIETLRKYAFAKFYMGCPGEATKLMQAALELYTSTTVSKIAEELPFSEYSNEYVYNGGYSNWGAFIHRPIADSSLPCLYSKIVSTANNREVFFYENIYGKLLNLPEVPKYYGKTSLCKHKLALITNELFYESRDSEAPLEIILKANGQIESIPYNQCLKLFKQSGYYTAKYYAMYLNKPPVLKEIIEEIERTVKPEELGLTVSLKELFITNKLYTKIIPRQHYTFCHNDFHKNNIKVDSGSNKCYIFDWENYSYAIKGWDMAYYFGNFEYDFKQIYEYYIQYKTDPIEQVFYVLMQLFIWRRRLHGRDWKEKATSHFIPALEYLRNMCEECANA